MFCTITIRTSIVIWHLGDVPIVENLRWFPWASIFITDCVRGNQTWQRKTNEDHWTTRISNRWTIFKKRLYAARLIYQRVYAVSSMSIFCSFELHLYACVKRWYYPQIALLLGNMSINPWFWVLLIFRQIHTNPKSFCCFFKILF